MSTGQPIDVRGMAIVHCTLRSVNEESAMLVRAGPSPSPAPVTLLAGHIDLAIAALHHHHHHHEGEDALRYPRLIERVPARPPVTEQAEHEHLAIGTALEAACAASRQRPSAQADEALAAALWLLPVVPPVSAPWSRCGYRGKSSLTAARRGRAG